MKRVHPDDTVNGAGADAGAEAQRGFSMLDCDVGLGPNVRVPQTSQPRAKFELSARARSTNAVMVPMPSPK